MYASRANQGTKKHADRAESFVLRELKKKYPAAQNWPGIEERFRVYMSRSEWVCGVPLVEVEKLIKAHSCQQSLHFFD